MHSLRVERRAKKLLKTLETTGGAGGEKAVTRK